ncbi:MAG: Eco57I restriction-modification methylase domain-containing protein [Fimbriimonadales bacterium]|nr:Eco57I restriction-modification methylase domain-containing protein [Fimbriimonadales bacterium]
MTPLPVARLMASMLECDREDVSILDAGAGIGSLLAAAIEHLCSRPSRPRFVRVVAYEIDPNLLPYLEGTLRLCEVACREAGVRFTGEIRAIDFIRDTHDRIMYGLFSSRPADHFDIVIQNPPYRKVNVNSDHRALVEQLGVRTTNLYAAFITASVRLLADGGELVAITPRSFCNGPYFRSFRKFLLGLAPLTRIHIFDSREEAFRDDSVLQETIIFRAVRSTVPPALISITSSKGRGDESYLTVQVPMREVVKPSDPESFIHIVQHDLSTYDVELMQSCRETLAKLGIAVSTGRVVDFRAKQYLRAKPEEQTAPLIYPHHFERGYVKWPKVIRKPNAIVAGPNTERQLVPNEHYVLVKRFSSKEERRRVVAAVYDADRVPCEAVGFENHLNYFHRQGGGVDMEFARGLCLFLNSTLVDAYFRQFNGHTQVNATDLRNMRYPTEAALRRLGASMGDALPDQAAIDALVTRELFNDMAEHDTDSPARRARIDEALSILRDLGLPDEQLNERSSLTLLALLGLRANDNWRKAKQTLIGITPIMTFIREAYGKDYAPNTRETIRRFTMHQFVRAGLALENPDNSERPTNSPNTAYQIEAHALQLLRTFGTRQWSKNLQAYLEKAPTLREQYQQAREMKRIPIQVKDDLEITLSPGGQNVLVERILTEFAGRYTPGGSVIYIGDAAKKHAFFDEKALSKLGVRLDSHGKMPDVVIHFAKRDWLVLIEAVTSHGPINPKRRDELREMFQNSRAGLVLVTAFLDRKSMKEYLPEISWETEVWTADAPDHLIHFNGERFLGPYET